MSPPRSTKPPRAPPSAVGLRADHRDVAAEIDQAAPRAALAQQLGDAVGGVLLHQPAEVQLHAGRQPQARGLPVQLRPADAGARCLQHRRFRQLPGLEVPGAAQHAGGEVEATAALPPGLGGVVEQGGRFGVEVQRGAAAAVDAAGQAVVAVAAVLGFQPLQLGAGALQHRGRTAPGAQFAGAAHGLEGPALQLSSGIRHPGRTA
jgi:hypothetical protein